MKFADKKCVPCQGGEPVLKKEETAKYLTELNSGWKLKAKPDKIVKDFEFRDFKGAVVFFNKVAKLAETEGHHPDILLHSYKKVRIELWTHKIGGLHKNDFILAVKIDNL